jgi:hypothetical protein
MRALSVGWWEREDRPALSRRAVLLLPLLLAACGGEEPPPPENFPPLDFSYLLPLPLNVASIDIVDRAVPSGQGTDVTALDPVSPADALRLMARQRLKAEGTSGRAVFIIEQASFSRVGDAVIGTMKVRLEIYPTPGVPAAYAEAAVTRSVSGNLGNLPAVLYGLTRQMMNQMNVEFEYQVRHALGQWRPCRRPRLRPRHPPRSRHPQTPPHRR